MKKRVLGLLLTVVMGAGMAGLFTGCTPRKDRLLIHNWEDYMNLEYIEDAETGFKAYYKAKTGKNVELVFTNFSTNEIMYDEIKNQEMDYDLVCPSDYMNERMQKEGLLLRIDKDIVYKDDEGNSILPEDIYDPEMLAIVSELDSTEHGRWVDYAVPYMWGTLGIMYSGAKVESGDIREEDMKTWACLFDDTLNGGAYKNNFFMKDSERDAFAVANIWLNRTTLAGLEGDAYMTELKKVMSDTDAIDDAIELLKQQKGMVFNYEVDKGKDELIAESDNAYFGLFWSCDAGYAMLENPNLYYEVPEEGSNVWFDAFVIPKHAKNPDAAQYFLKYLLEHDTSFENVLYVGASTPIITTTDAQKEYLDLDEDGFFAGSDHPEKFKDMYMRMMFPAEGDLLERCAMMRDFGDKATVLAQKWSVDVRTA